MQVHENNYLSLVAQNNLNKSQSALGNAIERLSSGLRINSAKDDAAGMAIANRFTANVRGLTQASRNANDGISMAQTTEGAASEITAHMQRIRELAVQSSNSTYSDEQLNSIQDEINQRMEDINRISTQTDFNGVKVLSANAKSLTLQVGANDGETISLNLREISTKTLKLDGFNVNGKGVTQNLKATETNVKANGGTAAASGATGDFDVTTNFSAISASQAFDKLVNGNKINTTITGGAATEYTYNSDNKDFSFTNSITNNTDTNNLATKLYTKSSGEFTFKNGVDVAKFKVDSSGNITDIANQKVSFDTKTGALTAIPGGTTALTQATLVQVLAYAGQAIPVGATGATAAGGAVPATLKAANTIQVTFGDTTYSNGATADQLNYTDKISKDDLLAKLSNVTTGSTGGATIDVNGTTVTFADAGLRAANTNVDDDGDFVGTTASVIKTYHVDAEGGVTTVGSSIGTGKHAVKAGEQVYINDSGKLTTKDKSNNGKKTENAMETLDKAFNTLNQLTGELGAVQNRLDSTISNLNNIVNNLQGARSRILDADYATEVSNMSRAQILQQAGTSVLAQANQVPQTVLSLLR